MTDFLKNAIMASKMTEKERAVAFVLARRVKCLEEVIPLREGADKAYFEGKKEGYMQAITLLQESEESVNIEIQ